MKVSGARSMVPGTEGKVTFRVVIAYADETSGKRAMDTCQVMASQLNGEVAFRSVMWKFEMLQHPEFSRVAAHDAIQADIILLAAGPTIELPDEAKRWIDGWIPHKRGQTAALVALLDSPPGGQMDSISAVSRYLEDAAANAQIDFLQQIAPKGKSPTIFPEASPLREGWGLND